VGCAGLDVLGVSDLFEPPEEGRGVEEPRQLAVLADCTIVFEREREKDRDREIEREREK